MDIQRLKQRSDYAWEIEPHGRMRVPGVIFASEELIRAMDDKVVEQLSNVATLPGIVRAAYAMPDAHWGYGFPIGGVAAFDPEQGVISGGGVGFDISCGVRTLHTNLTAESVLEHQEELADLLFYRIPAGLGSTGKIHLNPEEMDNMLRGGARWAVDKGYGEPGDLDHTEEQGQMPDADPAKVSGRAKRRQKDEMGTLGSGNHYLEVQKVTTIFDPDAARTFGIREGDIKITIHCGSRGLGHQIGTEYLKLMAQEAARQGIELPDRELASAPLTSKVGRDYLGAMRAGINCALANRQIITHLTRQAVAEAFPDVEMDLLFDVSHNTCKLEEHTVDGERRELYVHRKGATRAFGPGHPSLPADLRPAGQPVLIGGTMGSASYILAGTERSMELAWGSACHGAGRAMSRHQASRSWRGEDIRRELAERGILIRSPSLRGIAEESPGAYKPVEDVIEAADRSGLARKVARLEPVVCIKG